ncbi:MAG: outer membrane lipoprotein chaperone LolA [Gammaproteobacteria bacterium]|nr:outer membrane lipoprotein chaperone LolA [Gammaproteobacteria bacterium]
MVRIFLSALLALAFAQGARAGDLSPDKASQQLNQLLTDMQSMQAVFEQWVNDAKQTTLQHVTGSMWIQRPGHFRWDTDEPYPQQIVSDGKSLLIYDRDLEQATKKKLDNQIGNTPALLLSGDPQQIQQNFSVTGYVFENTGEVRFDLRPKDSEAMFSLLRVHFLQGYLRDMYLEDNLGQTTRIEFTKIQKNQKLDGKVFELNLPDSVDLIEES